MKNNDPKKRPKTLAHARCVRMWSPFDFLVFFPSEFRIPTSAFERGRNDGENIDRG
jgi:hypothetical protein